VRLARLPVALLLAACAIALAGFAGCGEDDDSDDSTSVATTVPEEGCPEVAKPPAKEAEFEKPDRVLKPGEPATATVQTSCGSFVIELDTKDSPKTANSFAFLAEQGFYDDTYFHRIVPGFVFQGGDPKGTGTGGPGYSVDEPPPDDTSYELYDVAMAKTEVEPPGRSGSQFFVVTVPDAGLPADYAVLGKVTEGTEVADQIAALGDPSTQQPTQVVTIESVTIDAG
jgi:cyclophilin family peptidyl-prolyl cis-trans isomerase